MLLQASSHLVRLYCTQIHQNNGHAGPSTLQAMICNDNLILGLRRLLKIISRSCVPCQKAYQRAQNKMMGHLPANRTRPEAPFAIAGLDFAGSLITVRGNPRRPTLMKTYVCLFVCFSTKAVHLELCYDLSSETAFRRFSNRRGQPAHVYCDNGRNFVGAVRKLKEVTQLLKSIERRRKVSLLPATQAIQWHFSPARSPHFGGLWEAAVRLMKLQLKKIMGHHRLTYPQLHSVIVEIEAILNSRPILPIHVDPEEGPTVLTPGHFLIGRPLKSLPARVDTPFPSTSLRRWNLGKRLHSDLWKAWQPKYLQALQTRSKWTLPQRNFKVGDVVLLKDEALRDRSWPMAVITTVHPGCNGLVHVVDLRARGKTYRRSTDRLVLLVPADQDRDDRGEDVEAPTRHKGSNRT